MPSESRILSFSPGEVFEALREFGNRTGRPIPADSSERLTFTKTGEVRIQLGSGGKKSLVVFSENDVGAALVIYCIGRRIPIAHNAVKSLEVAGKELLLHLRIPGSLK